MLNKCFNENFFSGLVGVFPLLKSMLNLLQDLFIEYGLGLKSSLVLCLAMELSIDLSFIASLSPNNSESGISAILKIYNVPLRFSCFFICLSCLSGSSSYYIL